MDFLFSPFPTASSLPKWPSPPSKPWNHGAAGQHCPLPAVTGEVKARILQSWDYFFSTLPPQGWCAVCSKPSGRRSAAVHRELLNLNLTCGEQCWSPLSPVPGDSGAAPCCKSYSKGWLQFWADSSCYDQFLSFFCRQSCSCSSQQWVQYTGLLLELVHLLFVLWMSKERGQV